MEPTKRQPMTDASTLTFGRSEDLPTRGAQKDDFHFGQSAILFNMCSHKTYQGSSAQANQLSAYQPYSRSEIEPQKLLRMGQYNEPPPPYPEDKTANRNFHETSSRYGQSQWQYDVATLPGNYHVPSTHHYPQQRDDYHESLGGQNAFQTLESNPFCTRVNISNKQGSMLQTSPPQVLQPPQRLTKLSRPSSPSYQSPSSSHSPSDEDLLSEALEFTKHTASIPSHVRRLQSPIAIPQTAPGLGQSFLRAWAPMLQDHNITMTDFLAFVDNLNIVSTANPPLQVLNLAGGIIGMVPHHWAMIAGQVIQTSAQLGTAAVSKGRTEMYMREVNDRMFKPRGMKVSLASTEAMRAVLRIPYDRPILAPLTMEAMRMTTVERVLWELQPYNAVLDLNVPPPAEQTTMLARLSAKQIAAQSKKNQNKILKEREKSMKKDEKRHKKDERKERRKDRKHGKRRDSSDDENDVDEEVGMSPDQRVIQGKKGKKDKEEKKAGKLLWILIECL
ncbi:hypothetical protein EG329_012672 [Mollisiaceae sp. DMI_Dod_QoI]|nr:hypothetical protein EG329_012672 [Helotiales sp. DMI_Dod_QoI]